MLSTYKKETIKLLGNDPSSDQLIQYIADKDPTNKKAYTIQLIKWYISGSIKRLEDVSKATEPLLLYSKFKNKLPPINTLSFDRFLDLSDTLIDQKSISELGKEEELEFYKSNQATLFYNSPEIKVVIPHTKKAAIYFGKNTRWCTSATNNNMFDRYNKEGHLYIILFKKTNVRWQFHFEETQFMNEKDEALSVSDITNNSEIQKIFGNLFVESVSQDGNAIQYIKNPSEEIQKIAVSEYGIAIKYIKNPSEEVQKIAVSQNGNAIHYIDNPSEEIQRIVVSQRVYAIYHIKNPSEELQKIAVSQDGTAIRYIKNPSEEIKKIAVSQNGHAIQYIENPSEEVKRMIFAYSNDSSS